MMSPIPQTEFKLFDEMFDRTCHTAEDLIMGARELILSSDTTEDCNVTLAKATNGNRALFLTVDRDNYEFSYRTLDGRMHVKGGFLASDLQSVTIERLKQAMIDYLERGTPIIMPGRMSRGPIQPRRRKTK